MSETTLAERVSQLEQQVAELLMRRDNGNSNEGNSNEPGRDDWMRTIGVFDGDATMKEVINETLKVREEDRQRTRP